MAAMAVAILREEDGRDERRREEVVIILYYGGGHVFQGRVVMINSYNVSC